MLAWKVRAALRAGAHRAGRWCWPAIDAMSEGARKEPVWVYWKARALLAMRRKPRPAPRRRRNAPRRARCCESIASVRGFYEQLALEELGQNITAAAQPPRR